MQPPRFTFHFPLFNLASAFLLELLLLDRKETGGRPEGLAVVVHGQIAHVQREHAAGAFLVDDDRDRAALDTLAEGEPASAGQPSVREPLQHDWIILQAPACAGTDLDQVLSWFYREVREPMVLLDLPDLPVTSTAQRAGAT